MSSRSGRALGCALAIAGMLQPVYEARAQTFQISGLVDVSFGTISSVATNRTVAQTVCVYNSLQGYTIKATGSGSGGAFTLANGSSTVPPMAYTVQWAFTGQQTVGTQLTTGVGSRSPAGLNVLCSLSGLLSASASLIVTLPAADLGTARAGNYTGTLSLMVSPN